MVVRQWVLVPESFHDDSDGLAPWVRKAHAAALDRGPASNKHAKHAPKTRQKPAAPRSRKTAAPPRPKRRQSSKKV